MSDPERIPEADSWIVVPSSLRSTLWAPRDGLKFLVTTRQGAAPQVAGEITLAARPLAPESLKIEAPIDPQQLRGSVDSDLGWLGLVMALSSVIVGAIGIANTSLVSVVERTREIGLRRALGARPRLILAQFLGEAAAIGFLGGLLGGGLGVLLVAVLSGTQGWQPVLPWAVTWASPLIGGVAGLMGGFYPSLRAMRVNPVVALRAPG